MNPHMAMMATLAALLLASAGGNVRAKETVEQAVAAVEKLGGMITRDDKARNRPIVGVSLNWPDFQS
jgi:hypothetical protein